MCVCPRIVPRTDLLRILKSYAKVNSVRRAWNELDIAMCESICPCEVDMFLLASSNIEVFDSSFTALLSLH